MPTIERTPAESVPRSAPIETERGTLAKNAERRAERLAEHPPAPDVKTLARQALDRIEARNGVRNAERNGSVPRRSAQCEAAEQPRERGRTALSPAWWRDYFEERAAIREHDGGLSRSEAEAGALADLAAHWRALNPLPASGDSACAHCCGAGPDTPVLAKGGRAWLHRACWAPMDAKRGRDALAEVKTMLESASTFDARQESLEIGAIIKLEQ